MKRLLSRGLTVATSPCCRPAPSVTSSSHLCAASVRIAQTNFWAIQFRAFYATSDGAGILVLGEASEVQLGIYTYTYICVSLTSKVYTKMSIPMLFE